MEDNHAWSINLTKYEHYCGDHSGGEFLNVRDTSQRNLSEQPLRVPPLRHTAEELKPDTRLRSGLFVGMRPWPLEEAEPLASGKEKARANRVTKHKRASTSTAKSARNTRKRKSVEQVADTAKLIEFDDRALRVVAILSGTKLKYYALIDQEKGLCEGALLSMDEVFFFAKFRDDTLKSLRDRKSQWSKKVKEAFPTEDTISTVGTKAQSAPFGNSATSTINNALSAYMSDPMHAQEDQDTTLIQATSLLRSAQADISEIPSLPIVEPALLAIVTHVDGVATRRVANRALQALLRLRPAHAAMEYTESEFIIMSKAVIDAKLSVSSKLIDRFILAFIDKHRDRNAGAMGNAELAEKAYAVAVLHGGFQNEQLHDCQPLGRTNQNAVLVRRLILSHKQSIVLVNAAEARLRTKQQGTGTYYNLEQSMAMGQGFPNALSAQMGAHNLYGQVITEVLQIIDRIRSHHFEEIKQFNEYLVSLDEDVVSTPDVMDVDDQDTEVGAQDDSGGTHDGDVEDDNDVDISDAEKSDDAQDDVDEDNKSDESATSDESDEGDASGTSTNTDEEDD